jgi:hypothetical protein
VILICFTFDSDSLDLGSNFHGLFRVNGISSARLMCGVHIRGSSLLNPGSGQFLLQRHVFFQQECQSCRYPRLVRRVSSVRSPFCATPILVLLLVRVVFTAPGLLPSLRIHIEPTDFIATHSPRPSVAAHSLSKATACRCRGQFQPPSLFAPHNLSSGLRQARNRSCVICWLFVHPISKARFWHFSSRPPPHLH